MRCLGTGKIPLSRWIKGPKREAVAQFNLDPRLGYPAPLPRFVPCARQLWRLSSDKNAGTEEYHGVGILTRL
jgi:hypothetical protein